MIMDEGGGSGTQNQSVTEKKKTGVGCDANTMRYSWDMVWTRKSNAASSPWGISYKNVRVCVCVRACACITPQIIHPGYDIWASEVGGQEGCIYCLSRLFKLKKYPPKCTFLHKFLNFCLFGTLFLVDTASKF